MQIEAPARLQVNQQIIKRLQETISQLRKSNSHLKQQLDRALRQKDQYRDILHSPLYHIFEGIDNLPINDNVRSFSSYQEQQRRVTIYRQKIQSYQQKFSLLTNQIHQKDQALKLAQIQLMKSQQSQLDLRRSNNLMTQQLRVLEDTNKNLLEIIKGHEKQIHLLMNGFEQLKTQLNQSRNNHEVFLNNCDQKIRNFYKGWIGALQFVQNKAENDPKGQFNNDEKVKQLTQKFRKQQIIMEEMGQQLDSRNEQIARLLSLQRKSQQSKQYHCDQHTIIEMVNSTRLRQERYRDLLEKFKQMLVAVQTSKKQKTQLEKQYQILRKEIESIKGMKGENIALKKEYEKYKHGYEYLKKQLQQADQNAIAIMEENQVFHHMMYEKYGHKVYQQKIEEELKKYEERQKEREEKQQWANVTELVNMNRKLRDKILRNK